MATAGNSVSVGTGGTEVFNAATDNQGAGCSGFRVHNLDNTNQALVNIPGLHAAGAFFGIPPGQGVTFRSINNAIRSVTVKSSASTVNIHFGIVETR